MDHILIELKKDNIMEQTLEADLPLRHGDRAFLLPGSVAYSISALISLSPKALVYKKIIPHSCRETKYTKHRAWNVVGVQ